MELSELLKAKIEGKGVTVPELAEKTGVAPQAIYNIIKGKTRRPRLNTLRKIASFFGIPVSVFLVAGRGGGTPENAADSVESDLETIWKKLEGVKAFEERLGKLEALLDRVLNLQDRGVDYCLELPEAGYEGFAMALPEECPEKVDAETRKVLSEKFIREGIAIVKLNGLEENLLNAIFQLLWLINEAEKGKE